MNLSDDADARRTRAAVDENKFLPRQPEINSSSSKRQTLTDK